MCLKTDSPLVPQPLSASDLEEVLLIERASFAVPWSRKMFLDELSNSNARLTVFKCDGKIVGYMCFWAVLDEAHLLNIAVHPMHRSKGYGKAIMAHLEARCRDEGLHRVILEVGRRNMVARDLYKQSGFSSIGFRKRYYSAVKDDALVMEKWLGQPETRREKPGRTGMK